jgi:teichuronic acid biosynthesis glycosyltransferase TuaC
MNGCCEQRESNSEFRVLMITSEWPTAELPNSGTFIRQQVESLSLAGVNIDLFPFRGARNPISYFQAWRQVRNKLSTVSYDLVHAQFGQSGLLALPKRLPLVVTFRGSDLQGIVGKNGDYTVFGRVLRTISKFVARLADEVIIVAEGLSVHLPQRSYHLIPSGLDLDLFRPLPKLLARKQLGLSETKCLVLFAADPANPLKRFALAQLVIRMLVDQLDVEIVVVSGVPRSVMPVYMSACDVLLLTSLHEGSPNVVKEALACNLPVVSVDVGDVRQRLAGVVGCVVCNDDHPTTIASALTNVLKRGDRIVGRSVIRDLDERRMSNKVISVYKQAVRRA